MDNGNLKVTVGVPVYNPNMAFLKECFESIKNQTYKNYEVVVIDDGSNNKEENEKMVKEYGFKYFYQENKGIGGVRNSIIDRMSEDSDYLCYLSCDDVYHIDYLKIMCDVAKRNNGCILFSNILLTNDKGQIIMEHRIPELETYEDFCVACLSYAEKDNMFVNFSTTFFPADIIRKERFDENFRYGEDLEYLLRTAVVKKYRYIPVPYLLVKVRMHMSSETTKKIDEIPKNNTKILKKIWGMLDGEADS